jgi:hemolysin III
MGWMMVWTGGDFLKGNAWHADQLNLTGGLPGRTQLVLFFFLWEKWKWHHAVWHLFALVGAVCHCKKRC